MADGSLYVSVKALPVKLRHKLNYSNQPAPFVCHRIRLQVLIVCPLVFFAFDVYFFLLIIGYGFCKQ